MDDAPITPVPRRLPGIGERLDLTDAAGAPLHAIRHRSGHVELHSPDRVIELTPLAASTLGAFIAGRFRLAHDVAERLDDVLGGLAFDWVRLQPGDAAVGHTIEELAVRRRTGVTIVAILRGSVPIVAPDPSVRLERGDELVIACRDEDRERFLRVMTEGA